jgi:hypothetical protein
MKACFQQPATATVDSLAGTEIIGESANLIAPETKPDTEVGRQQGLSPLIVVMVPLTAVISKCR